MTNASKEFATVEYAVRDMFKGHSLASAAKRTAKKFDGYENMFLGPGVIHVDESELEEALWDRMIYRTIEGVRRMRDGFEHFALDGTVAFYKQTRFKKMRAELKERVIARFGHDPFTNDDK